VNPIYILDYTLLYGIDVPSSIKNFNVRHKLDDYTAVVLTPLITKETAADGSTADRSNLIKGFELHTPLKPNKENIRVRLKTPTTCGC
jgi:hypothetical protein